MRKQLLVGRGIYKVGNSRLGCWWFIGNEVGFVALYRVDRYIHNVLLAHTTDPRTRDSIGISPDGPRSTHHHPNEPTSCLIVTEGPWIPRTQALSQSQPAAASEPTRCINRQCSRWPFLALSLDDFHSGSVKLLYYLYPCYKPL